MTDRRGGRSRPAGEIGPEGGSKAVTVSLGGRPLAVGAAALAAGACAGVSLSLFHSPIAFALGALAALASGLAFWRESSRSLAWPLVALALGLARGAAVGPPVRDAPLDEALSVESFDALAPRDKARAREPLLIEGLVLESERSAPGLRRVLLELSARELLSGSALQPAASARALLAFAESDDPAVLRLKDREVPRRGDRIRLLARLHLPSPALNPGAPDRRRQLWLRGIAYEGSAAEDGLRILARGPRWQRRMAELRERFADRCAEVCASRERGALVAALAVGLRADLPRETDDELAASGLIHLLASAGLHLAAVCLLVQWVVARLWLRTRWASGVRASAVGALFALPFAAAEVALLGASWPAVRAGLSAALWLLAGASDRRSDSITALTLSAALCALVDPASLHDLPLLLSLLGVAGLIFLTGPLRDLIPIPRPAPLPPASRMGARLRQRARRLLEHALLAGCATLAATLCTAPLQAEAFHRLSLVGVIANALALWPGLVAIPLATAAVPLDAAAPPLALAPLWLSDLCAGATLRAAELFSRLPAAQIALPAPGLVTIALWLLVLLALSGFPAPIGPGTSQHRPPARVRLLRAAVPLLLLTALGAGRALWPRMSSTMTLTFLSVGQGDAALIRFPGGRTMLVDGGGDLFATPGRPRGRGPGERDLLPALAELGISRLDWAVLTHPHPDHAGGLLAVLRKVPVAELWTTGEPGPASIGDQVRSAAAAQGSRLVEPGAGQSLGVGGVRLEVLYPTRWDSERDANDNSLVLRLVHGKVSILLAGDLEALAEADLAQSGAPLEATLLKAPHHGSRTSSTDAFLRRVRPRHVVFCVGARNPFGFPHPEVVEHYRAERCETWRTDRGAITAESDGERLRLRQDTG